LLKKPFLVIRSLNLGKFKKWIFSLRGLFLISPFLDKEHKYDVIHCHFGHLGLNGLFLKEIGAIQGQLITSFHGYDVNALPQQLGENLYIHLFEHGKRFTCGSTFMFNKVMELGCPQEKLIKLPVGVNCTNYRFRQRNLSINEPIKIITVARLVEKKGLEYSVKAIASVAQEYPNLIYKILGEGLLRESLQKLIQELGMETKIQLLGWKTKDEVCELYDDSHIFILSSVTAENGDKEGQGLVLQEAQAMGLPVLATLHNGFPDSVLDGQSAFLVPERDVEALAAKLIFLIQHPEQWAEMGRVGRKFVETHFDIENLNEQLVDIYQELVEVN
jgi:colanic acid/amylovoran biosynthesis glycosyltransferase